MFSESDALDYRAYTCSVKKYNLSEAELDAIRFPFKYDYDTGSFCASKDGASIALSNCVARKFKDTVFKLGDTKVSVSWVEEMSGAYGTMRLLSNGLRTQARASKVSGLAVEKAFAKWLEAADELRHKIKLNIDGYKPGMRLDPTALGPGVDSDLLHEKLQMLSLGSHTNQTMPANARTSWTTSMHANQVTSQGRSRIRRCRVQQQQQERSRRRRVLQQKLHLTPDTDELSPESTELQEPSEDNTFGMLPSLGLLASRWAGSVDSDEEY
jgi:hypothetical protein